MGVADRTHRDPTWSLLSLDDGTEILGQFPAQNLIENVAGVWAEQATLGLDQPILQFIRGELETIQMDVKVWAQNQAQVGVLEGERLRKVAGGTRDDILATVDRIRSLARSDPALGRPHIWLLTVGHQFLQRVVIRSVGGIRYDRLRSDGSLRGVLFRLDMARFVPFDIGELVGPAESLVAVAQRNETYEHIAKRTLGDATLGEALRRRNPERRDLTAGDRVHVPSADILRRESLPLQPQSLFFQPGDAQRQVLLDAFDLHGQPVESHVLLEDQ